MSFYHNQNTSKYKSIPIEISKNNSDKVIDLLINKNDCVFIKKLNRFLGNHICRYICRRCSNSNTSQGVLINHMQRCDQQEKISIRLRTESQL